MPVKNNKIQELKDAMSLDIAESSYLNTISGNYGLQRPLLGFTDATWRAVTKILALQYKQITNKFRDVLEIILGPDVTKVTNIIQSYPAGVSLIKVNDASQLPQTGVLVLDKGTAIEETIAYKFIEYKTNTIFLSSKTVYSHQAPASDGETVLLYGAVGTTLLYGVNTESLPQTGFPFPLVVGRGTELEETVAVTGNDVSKGLLTVSALANTHTIPSVSLVKTALTRPYARGSFFLNVEDASTLPTTGVLKLGLPNSPWSTTAFPVAAASTTTVINVAPGTFSTADSLAGSYLALFGPISGLNRGTYRGEFLIKSNTTSSITLAHPAPVTPLTTYTFDIRPVVEYSSTSAQDGSITLKYTIPAELPLPVGTEVEFLDQTETISTGTVQVLGINWKVVQATPYLVEILIPFSEDQLQNLRTASYIHSSVLNPTPTTTVSNPAAIGSDVLEIASSSSFPQSGTLVIDLGGSNEEFVAFQKRSATEFYIPYSMSVAHLAAETVALYQPAHGSTDVFNGDIHGIVDNLFPGPYVYGEELRAQKSTAITSLSQHLAAPTLLSVGVVAGSGPKAIEVENAKLFPSSGTFSIRVGTESMTASAVSLATRAISQLNGNHILGATTLTVDAGTLNPGGVANFPNANGYRVLVGRGTSTAEIVYVTGISTGSNTITIQAPGLRSAQNDNALVELLTDVVTVGEIDVAHIGLVSYADRSPSVVAPVPEATVAMNYTTAESVEVLYSNISVTDGTGFPTTGGYAIISFGGRVAKNRITSAAAGVSSLVLQSSDSFPSTGLIEITGERHPTVYSVTANNTGTDTLTITETTKSPLTGRAVSLVGGSTEIIQYASRSGNILTLTTPLVVQSNHQSLESISFSEVPSLPSELGTDFALRAPLNFFERLEYLFNLVRAAGVQVKVIQNKVA